MEVSTSILVTLYLIMLGPLKLITPYSLATAGAHNKLLSQIAFRATIVSVITAALIAILAGYLISRLNLSPGVLAITMGFYMLLWSFTNALGRVGDDVPKTDELSIKLAYFPIAMPGIIPPHGVALLILSTVVQGGNWFENIQFTLMLIVIVMAINWLFMLVIPSLLKLTGIKFWKVLSRVVAVIMSVVSLQIILFGLKALEIL